MSGRLEIGAELRLPPRLMTRERMRWYVDVQDTVAFDDGRIHTQPPSIHDDDDYASPEEIADVARALDTPHRILPGAGHINVASGYGPWPFALEWLKGVL